MASVGSAKVKTVYVCQDCGHESVRWQGQCMGCSAWNTLVEETRTKASKKDPVAAIARSNSILLSEVQSDQSPRMTTGLAEFDRVMGGGITAGSVTLIAGDPGIGKSTLMTSLAGRVDADVLYIAGEESPAQILMRAARLGVDSDKILLVPETNLESLLLEIRDRRPALMIVDSIQTVYRPEITSAPGSVAQVRESAALLMQISKRLGISTFLVGHVTKDGMIAGPRVLEHMVDTVLYFEGDRHHAYRILRTMKNRFGSTNEIGLFEMRSDGLAEVQNPSQVLLSERQFGLSGSSVICSMEGTRPILAEIQALVTPATYGTPQRTSSGFDAKRLQMLLAVLQKRVGLEVATHDVFVNVTGGLRLDEPAADLGVAVAVASSLRDIPSDSSTVVMGEVGLGGELRAISHIQRRLSESSKLGFERVLMPKPNLKSIEVIPGLEATGANSLEEALDVVL